MEGAQKSYGRDQVVQIINSVVSKIEASGTIMDACDVIQSQTANLDGEAASAINDAVIKIFEACSFQDITGQRITKVVSTLKTIEQKVSVMVDVLGQSMSVQDQGDGAQEEISPEKKLLNGPQLPANAITQNDIDKLLESL